MFMTRYEPGSLLNQFRHQIGRLFSQTPSRTGMEPESWSFWMPAADLREDEAHYYIELEVPGVSAKDVDITVQGDTLTVSGRREQLRDETRDGVRYSERAYGSFERRFVLANMAGDREVDARMENGVLKITVQKAEPDKPRRRIEVKGSRALPDSPPRNGARHGAPAKARRNL